MAGGQIVVHPYPGSAFIAHETTIAGNTCLYGATGGKFYAAGCAGERFAVRNSGAFAVVEGVGDNGCEYMTGGVVCVLGKTGINFGAGMTGGFAYLADEDGSIAGRVNPEMTESLAISNLPAHQEHLRGILQEHLRLTGSARANAILNAWTHWVGRFILVKPKSADLSTLITQHSRVHTELRLRTPQGEKI